MKESIILAVDGGATKTTLTIRSTLGNCLYEKITSGTNYQAIGINGVIDTLSTLLKDASHSTNLDTIHVAVFAMAGIDTKDDLDNVTSIIKECLQRTNFNVNQLIIENDVQSTLLGLVSNHPGALLISGTGSIALGTDCSGNIIRTGGWGHRAGDEGSGYWIGRQIVKAILRAEDGRNQPTLLKKLVFDKLQIDSIDQLMNWLYQEDYKHSYTASLSTVLPEAVTLNDEIAIQIAQDASKHLYLLIKATLAKLSYKGEPFTLFLNGSILKYHPYILNSLLELIQDAFPHIHFVLCKENPIEDIVRRAKNALNPQ